MQILHVPFLNKEDIAMLEDTGIIEWLNENIIRYIGPVKVNK